MYLCRQIFILKTKTMKKTLLSALLSLLSITMYAYSCNQHVLHLSAGYVDETPAYHGKGKAPVRIPVIYQDNHAFSFQSCPPDTYKIKTKTENPFLNSRPTFYSHAKQY